METLSSNTYMKAKIQMIMQPKVTKNTAPAKYLVSNVCSYTIEYVGLATIGTMASTTDITAEICPEILNMKSGESDK